MGTLLTGANAVVDEILSYQKVNKLKNHFYAATGPADATSGVIWIDSDDDKAYLYDGAAWDEILTVNSVITGTGSLVRANAPTGIGQWVIPTIDLTGGQIAFPAGAVPSADPNTIDEYEEGTWTPIVIFGGASVDVAYHADTAGYYTRVGNAVTTTGRLRLTNKGTSVGAAAIGGLPFTVTNNTAAQAGLALGYLTGISFADFPQGAVTRGSTQVELFETTNGGALSTLRDVNFTNASRVDLGFIYRAG